MAIIVGIKFRSTNKIYYFDPQKIDFKEGDGVIVETSRGLEYATVSIPNKDVDESEIVQPLKPVVRKATEEDEKKCNAILKTKKRHSKQRVKKSPKPGLI